MDEILSPTILHLRSIAREVARDHIAPKSAQVDSDCTWPRHSITALAEVGLLGLHVPKRLGGYEQGLLALAVTAETIAGACASSALCYSMHCVGSAVLASKATRYHEDRYLRPISEGKHVTTLALSESGTGVHFYLPQTKLQRREGGFTVTGTKQFVTSGGQADSYVLSTQASPETAGAFNCLVVDADAERLMWTDPWRGFGMRGNASASMQLNDVWVPYENLLGREGDQIWYIFVVVAPYFLIGMAGTYVGIAQKALEMTVDHLTNRQYAHSGEVLADVPLLQRKVAEMTAAVERTRALVYHAAYLGDAGDAKAVSTIMLAKAEAGDTSVWVANEAMTCCGGRAYRENSDMARLLRDARASHVMAPTTDLLKTWAARLLLNRPLF
jgi:isovaleryl-CoA dehydrogenase